MLKVYIDIWPVVTNTISPKIKPTFENLNESTLLLLHNLPVFGTTSEIIGRTKFLMSRIYNVSLLLKKEYQIHVHNIHKLTVLSMDGRDISMTF